MAYEEYLDLIEKANNSDTKYVLYVLDGVGEDRKNNQKSFVDNSLILMNKMKDLFLNNNSLVDEYPIKINNKESDSLVAYYNNPCFIKGDLIGFYFYKDKINDSIFKKAFDEAYECTSKQFRYHFSKCNYETNDYSKGNNLLYVGYALAYLNDHKEVRLCTLGNKNRLTKK